MSQLPTGTITFLLTDVVGSTRLWEAQPEAMAKGLSRHDELVGEAVKQHRGWLPMAQGEGDSALAVFRRATDAVACALRLQRAFVSEPWSEGTRIAIRIALHTGEAEMRDDSYYGLAVNRCARLRAIAHGRQIVMSRPTFDLVQDHLPEGATVRDLGSHLLRDLSRPERVYQLCHPDLPSDFPPLTSLGALPNNLPAQLTSFIGRELEMVEVKKLLLTQRLVTLTGAGGSGKTRLALQVAADLLDDYPDGVWLVDLAALNDPALVLQAVASAVGASEEPGRRLEDTLFDYLRSRKQLLILDNCEHLIGACAEVAEALLLGCPDLKILATSREALGVAGETSWRVPSLSLPPRGASPSPETLAGYEAVYLLVDRASQVVSNFQITRANAAAVAEICFRLDGIPLAIELAAAKLKVLTIDEINDRLEDRFALLTGGSRTALERQQTLRALVDWSYDLLTQPERVLLHRLSVFAGGFVLDAAEHVCSGNGVEQNEVLGLLGQLVDKSLVLAEGEEDVSRYRLLETIRQYGREKLLESKEGSTLRARHRDWFLSVAERAEPNLEGRDQDVWLDRLEIEHDNFRAALEWSMRTSDDAALRLAGALWRFWFGRGHWTEGRRWLEEALASAGDRPTAMKGKAHDGAGGLAAIQGDYGAARDHFEASLAITRHLEDERGILASLLNLGNVAYIHSLAFSHGPEPLRRSDYEQALEIARDQQHDRGVLVSLHNLANVALTQGDFASARPPLEEALAIATRLGDKGAIAISAHLLGVVAQGQHDYTSAQSFFRQTLTITRELGVKWAISASLRDLGAVAQAQGDYPAARALHEEALEIARESGDRRVFAGSLLILGNLAYEQGDYSSARSCLEESLATARGVGDTGITAAALVSLANLAQDQGDYSTARSVCEEALDVARQSNDRVFIAAALRSLGWVALDQGDYVAALPPFEESLAIARELDDKGGIAWSLHGLGTAALAQGDYRKARSCLEESLAIARQLGAREAIAWYGVVPRVGEQKVDVASSLGALAEVSRAENDYDSAASLFKEALTLRWHARDQLGISQCLEALAEVAVSLAQFERAARLLGAADALRSKIGFPIRPLYRLNYDAAVAASRAGQGEDQHQELFEEGQQMTLDEAVEYALR